MALAGAQPGHRADRAQGLSYATSIIIISISSIILLQASDVRIYLVGIAAHANLNDSGSVCFKHNNNNDNNNNNNGY